MESMYQPAMNNPSMPHTSLIPVLIYPDIQVAIEWLCRVFDFKLRWQAGNHRAQLAIGSGAIAITASTNNELPPYHSTSFMVRVSDIDAHYHHCLQQQATILSTPSIFPYGEKQYSVIDIGNYIWTFSQSVKSIDPVEWGAGTAG